MREYITLTLREQPYTFRALDLDQVEELEPQFTAVATLQVTDTVPREGFAAVAAIAHASLQAKHPGLSLGEVRKLLTLATIESVMNAVRGISGLDPQPGEAAVVAIASTGPNSAP